MIKAKKNKIIIAAAGSGKTTHLVKEAINNPQKRILITTYTDANTQEIKAKFYEKVGYIPKNIHIMPWFSFLLTHCVRPYQGQLFNRRVDNLILIQGISAKGFPENNVRWHYFNSEGRIYSDKISKFAFKCNEINNGLVCWRLGLLYDAIFIDEIQDLAGWDLDLLNLLFNSRIEMLCVGDPRQGLLTTNNSNKHKNKSQTHLLDYFKSIQKEYELDIDTTSLSVNHRSVVEICDFSNSLYSGDNWPKTTSDYQPRNIPHTGVFIVDENYTMEYLSTFNPIQLKRNINVKVNPNYTSINYGKSKGLTLERTLIYPTDTMMDWLYRGKDLSDGTRCDFYVAITRARYSVGIVRKKKYAKYESLLPIWEPSKL